MHLQTIEPPTFRLIHVMLQRLVVQFDRLPYFHVIFREQLSKMGHVESIDRLLIVIFEFHVKHAHVFLVWDSFVDALVPPAEIGQMKL